MSNLAFRLPGVLDTKELLVAEAIQARAWEEIRQNGSYEDSEATAAKAKLGRIV